MPPIRADGIAVYVYRTVASRSKGARPRYEFLQIRRSSTAEGYNLSWQIVYGGVKGRENSIAAALRELAEETSLTPIRMFQVEFLETFYFRPEDYVLVMPVFAAEVSYGAEITLNHEHTAHRWIPENRITRNFMWRTQREALTHILDHLHHGSLAEHFLEIPMKKAAKFRRKSR